MCDYIHRTPDTALYSHGDPIYPFEHVFMSPVLLTPVEFPTNTSALATTILPVGPRTCSRLMRTIMTRIVIDARFMGGSVRMAAASAAIDRSKPIDVVLNTGRWTSWTVFDTFYNRSRLMSVFPPIGRTSLA